jgi:hypothetical protein
LKEKPTGRQRRLVEERLVEERGGGSKRGKMSEL